MVRVPAGAGVCTLPVPWPARVSGHRAATSRHHTLGTARVQQRGEQTASYWGTLLQHIVSSVLIGYTQQRPLMYVVSSVLLGYTFEINIVSSVLQGYWY